MGRRIRGRSSCGYPVPTAYYPVLRFPPVLFGRSAIRVRHAIAIRSKLHREMTENVGQALAGSVVAKRICVLLCIVLAAGIEVEARAPLPLPAEFLVGRHTFFDFGPPTDFYELFYVHSTANGSAIEKITLIPAADVCLRPATVEFASASVPDTIATILGSRNPCEISERRLRKERSRKKSGLVFSGADISMEVDCAGKARIIRADILDRDMFDSATRTPENTWTMQLLSRLDSAVGTTPMDKPLFPVSYENGSRQMLPDTVRQRLVSGGYDQLFDGAPDKPSGLYKASQVTPPKAEVRLLTVVPAEPQNVVFPTYPPIAKLARIEGIVVITGQITSSGAVTHLAVESGHPMLREAAKQAVGRWHFSGDSASQQVNATFEFKLQCASPMQPPSSSVP